MSMRLFALLAVAGLVTFALAGMIEPALAEQMAGADALKKFSVMIGLTEQLDAEGIIMGIKNKEQRWQTTVAEAKALAARSQAGLLSELSRYEAQGKVRNVEGLWIVNAIYCEATAEVISMVAQRPEVWFVQWDLIPTENALALGPATSVPDILDGDTDAIEWNVRQVKADSVWLVYGFKGDSVVVGDIDTGCDYTHSDLAGRMWTDPNYPKHGWDFADNDNDPRDTHGHGTHTCGTVAGDGTGGDTTGMAPRARIMTCRTKTSISQPYPDTIAENSVMRSMQFCVAPPLSPTNHAHLLTMSLGWIHSWSPRRAVWRQAVANVAAAGLPFFIAAGNEASTAPPNSVRTPGNCPGPWKHPAEAPGGLGGAISIGATDNADNIASFSSRGPVKWDTIAPFYDYPMPTGLLRPDFAAPGVNIVSTKMGGGYTQMSGTSMATPCAAGVCALMLSKNPSLLPEEVDEIMQNSVKPLGSQPKNNTYGTGRIDAMRCIENTPEAGPRHDVSMEKILVPVTRIDPLVPVAPTVVVRNRGTYHESNVVFHCRVESLGREVYYQSRTIAVLDSAGVDTIVFPNWNVGPGSQTYNLTFWHYQVPDTNRANDTLRLTVTTLGHDIRTVAMNVGTRVRGGAPLLLRVTLASLDYAERNFRAYCLIDSSGTVVYRDSVAIDSVPPLSSRVFSFPSNWNVGPESARYSVKMWHDCRLDQNRNNDTLIVSTMAANQRRILLLYADYARPETTLGVRLSALGDSVEYFNVQNETPRLAFLRSYDAVGTQSNYPYSNKVALGDTLAAYVDSGGGVVIGQFSYATGWELSGRVMTGNYATIAPGLNTPVLSTLGWKNSAHPTMAGIGAVQDNFRALTRFASEAESVACWADGRPCAAVSRNGKVVGLNQYPGIVPSQRGGDWALLWHNALMFVSGAMGGVEEFDPICPALHVTLSTAPNPTLRRVTVNYLVASSTDATVCVYDRPGRLVRSWSVATRPSLVGSLVWDLTDIRGQRVPAGVYFCRLAAGGKTVTSKVVVE